MFWSIVLRLLSHFASFALIVTFVTWFILIIGAALTFVIRSDHFIEKTFNGFLRYCLPTEMMTTKSCRVDTCYFFVNRALQALLYAPLLVGSTVGSLFTYNSLAHLFGPHRQNPASMFVWICVAVVVTIGVDFATFYTHYLDHKIPALWEFHKVHHSPEFLIPLTNKRFHPVQDIFDNAGSALTMSILLGGSAYLFSTSILENTVFGIDLYYLVNAVSFHHLRHSHINMTYGPFERLLLSPAQHQLHHSRETRHWDKNFGLFLSVWDRLFGTFLYSEPRGSFGLGLPGAEGQHYSSILQLYTTPFVNVFKSVQRRFSGSGIVVTITAVEDATFGQESPLVPHRQSQASGLRKVRVGYRFEDLA